LFCNMASAVIIAGSDGISVKEAKWGAFLD
jgi:hypothetical protein